MGLLRAENSISKHSERGVWVKVDSPTHPLWCLNLNLFFLPYKGVALGLVQDLRPMIIVQYAACNR